MKFERTHSAVEVPTELADILTFEATKEQLLKKMTPQLAKQYLQFLKALRTVGGFGRGYKSLLQEICPAADADFTRQMRELAEDTAYSSGHSVSPWMKTVHRKYREVLAKEQDRDDHGMNARQRENLERELMGLSDEDLRQWMVDFGESALGIPSKNASQWLRKTIVNRIERALQQ